MGQGKRRLVIRLAWGRTVTQLAGSYGRAGASALLAITGSYGAFWVSSSLQREWPSDELIPLYVTGLLFTTLWFIVFLYNWLFAVPYDKWIEAEDRVVELQHKLTPTVAFTLENGGYAKEFPVGTVTEVVSGDYVTNQTGNARYICASIENLSSFDVTSALVTLTRLNREGGERLSDAVELDWHNRKYSNGYEFIPADSQRTALLFRVTGDRVYLAGSDPLTLEQVGLIKGDAPYRGKLTVTHGADASLVVDFVLKLSPEPQLVLAGME